MRRVLLMTTIAAVIGVACGGNEQPAQDTEEPAADVITLRADDMTGDVEVPPGDPEATGSVTLDLDVDGGEVCFEYEADLNEAPTAMHVHEGEAGTAGDPVIDLPLDGGCVDAESTLLEDIVAEPAGYYVNIHTGKYPDGAIRAQLERE